MATKVSAWDRMLVDNSDKISKLYARTFQAERDTAEVERQLSAVENQQNDLNSYLDVLEQMVDNMERESGSMGAREGGVDGERERVYVSPPRQSPYLIPHVCGLPSTDSFLTAVTAQQSVAPHA